MDTVLSKMRAAALTPAVLGLLLLAGPAFAEDIDIYAGVQPDGAKPNLLVILDNSAAWDASVTYTCTTPDGWQVPSNNSGKAVGFEQCALHNAVEAIGSTPSLVGNINMGLMLFGSGSTNGGVFVTPTAQPYTLPAMTASGITGYVNAVDALDRNGNKSNGSAVGATMQEAWAYYSGHTGLSGTRYTSPIASACQKNFVLYIANANNMGKPQDSGQTAFNALVAAGASTAQQQQISIPTYNKYQSNWGDEWARFMYQTDLSGNYVNQQNIVTYTIAVTDGSNPDYVAFLKSMAANGGGKSFVVTLGDTNGLVQALLQIFNELQAVNTVFASSSLPVSVNAQGTYLNQVYMGMFRPDQNDNPRWMGNLKQYQLGVDNSNPASPQLFLADATGAPAINSAGTGFLSPNAVSFWTSKNTGALPDSIGGFWVNDPQGAGGGYDLPDGEIVEKGGVGQQLRLANLTDNYSTSPASPRKMYTCISSCSSGTPLSSMPFATTNANITAALLGVSSANLPALINWVRGDDDVGDEPSPGNGITVRPSVHGDVVHSRPGVIDYGSGGVVVYYGANDGTFRAVNGNQTANIGTVPPGGELWSFVPVEFYSRLSRLYANSPVIKLATTPMGLTPTPTPKDYYFDGATGIFQNPATGQAYVFLSARRGGRLLYALDVSSPTNPKFMWKHSSTDAGFGELGYTWSQPKVAMVKGYANPVLIFGAGYDLNEDSEPPATDTMGRGIFILDAVTGNIVWKASAGGGTNSCSGTPCLLQGMTHALPADITLVDRNADGYIDRLYAADTGGNIWRVDLEPNAGNTPSNWQVNLLAALGGSGGTKRKFFYPPDFVPGKTFDIVLDGTGDREHPLLTNQSSSIVNRFYMLEDTNTGPDASGWMPITDNTPGTADTPPADLFNATNAPYDGSLSGFYVSLTNPGEKVVNGATTIGGYTYFGTNQPEAPNANTCQANLGIARGYQLSFMTGSESNVLFQGGGLPPSPVTGLVYVTIGGVQKLVPFLIGAGTPGSSAPDAKSSIGAQRPTINISGSRRRTFWYRQHD